MTTEYKYENLSSEPNMGMLQDAVASSSMKQTEWSDISYHPKEHWLKIWFEKELSEEDQTTLQKLVTASLGIKKFATCSGSVFFELIIVNGRRWQCYRKRVIFPSEMLSVPKVAISNATFDGSANLELLNVTKKYFDFRVTAVNGSALRGLTSVGFDWEAKSWEV